MSGEGTGAGMDLDDINLPLDEIISRKAHREQTERPARGGFIRRGGISARGNNHNNSVFAQRQYLPPPPLPPPPQAIFEHNDQHPVHEQSGTVPSFGTGPPFPPYYHEHPNFMNHPYPWDPRNEGPMMHPNFTQNPMEPCWIPPPPPFDQGNVTLVKRTQPPPRQREVVQRGGVRKPIIRKRQGGPRAKNRHQDVTSTSAVEMRPKEEERCKLNFDQGTATMVFRGVEILKVNNSGDLVLTTEGHQNCGGFFKALNDVLSLTNMEILGEEDKRDTWKVKDTRTLFRYYDGICIKGKGDPSKSRAETIRKAFEQSNPKALEATLASNLAARRLGLAFDPMSGPSVPGPGSSHGVSPSGSIRITQDQQLTRTSNYSISFVDQEKEEEHPPPTDSYSGSYPLPDTVRRRMAQGRIIHPY